MVRNFMGADDRSCRNKCWGGWSDDEVLVLFLSCRVGGMICWVKPVKFSKSARLSSISLDEVPGRLKSPEIIRRFAAIWMMNIEILTTMTMSPSLTPGWPFWCSDSTTEMTQRKPNHIVIRELFFALGVFRGLFSVAMFRFNFIFNDKHYMIIFLLGSEPNPRLAFLRCRFTLVLGNICLLILADLNFNFQCHPSKSHNTF